MNNIWPNGTFSLIYCDPPWSFSAYSADTGLDRAPDAHYSTMQLSDMVTLPVSDIAAKDAMLAMWVYDPMIPGSPPPPRGSSMRTPRYALHKN